MASSGIKDTVYKIWIAPWKELAEETEVLERSKEYFVQPWVEIAGAASTSLQRSKPDPKDLSVADFDVELDSEGGSEGVACAGAEPPRASSRAELAVIFDTLDIQQRRADEAKARERLERDTWRQRAQSQRTNHLSYRSAPSLDQSNAGQDIGLTLDQPSQHAQSSISECLEIFSLLISAARGVEAARIVTDDASTKLTNLGARARVLVAMLVLVTAVVVYVMGAHLGWGVDTQLSGFRMHFSSSVIGNNTTENTENTTKPDRALPVNGTRQRHHDPQGGGTRRKRHTGVGPADLDPHTDELEQENEEAEWRDHPANRLGKPDAVDLEEFDDEPLSPNTPDEHSVPSKDQDQGPAQQVQLQGESVSTPAPTKQDADVKYDNNSDHSNQAEHDESGNTNVTAIKS